MDITQPTLIALAVAVLGSSGFTALISQFFGRRKIASEVAAALTNTAMTSANSVVSMVTIQFERVSKELEDTQAELARTRIELKNTQRDLVRLEKRLERYEGEQAS